MPNKYRLGAACLVRAFMPVSLFAIAADSGGPKSRASAWAPKVSYSDANPAIWTDDYAGLSAGYGWGKSDQNCHRTGKYGIASTNPEGAQASTTRSETKHKASGAGIPACWLHFLPVKDNRAAGQSSSRRGQQQRIATAQRIFLCRLG